MLQLLGYAYEYHGWFSYDNVGSDPAIHEEGQWIRRTKQD